MLHIAYPVKGPSKKRRRSSWIS